MIRHFFISLLLITAVTGCAVNPVTGESELSLVSAQQEVAIGEENYLVYQQQQGGEYVLDDDLTPYVAEVGQTLARVSDRPELPYEFVVLNNNVPNAWALPGGKIAINRGLLVVLEDEAQLAAVLGHEIVHAAARHGAQKMTQQQILGAGVALVSIAGTQTDYGEYIGMGAMGGAAMYQAHYGRSQELQSDRYGMEYMVRAGYEPQAAVELQETFVKLSEGQSSDFFTALFASHPPSHERVEKNQEMAKSLPSGKRNREAYQAAIAQIKKDIPAYKKQQEALNAMQEGEMDKASALLDEAIKLQPKESLFYVAKGQIQLNQKAFAEAETSFSKAYEYNPGYFMSSLGLGLAERAQKKNAAAKQHLEASTKIVPTPIAMYHLGDIALEGGDKQTAANYFKQVAQSGGDLGQAASKKLNEMGYSAQ